MARLWGVVGGANAPGETNARNTQILAEVAVASQLQACTLGRIEYLISCYPNTLGITFQTTCLLAVTPKWPGVPNLWMRWQHELGLVGQSMVFKHFPIPAC